MILPVCFESPVETLAKGGRSAVPVLAELCKDPEEHVRILAAEALSNISANDVVSLALTRGLRQPREQLPRGESLDTYALIATGTLKRIGPPAIPALIEALESEDAWVRIVAAWTIAEIGPEAHTLENLKQQNSGGCLEVLSSCIFLDSVRIGSRPRTSPSVTVPILLEFLNSPNRDHWLNAIVSVRYVGPEGSEAARFLPKFISDPDKEIRKEVAKALGRIGADPEITVPALVQLCRDENKHVRLEAAESLGRIRQKADLAVPALVRMLEDQDVRTRRQAATALGEFGQPARDAILPLLGATKDPSIRKEALVALQNIWLFSKACG
jgi:HEAT repeat protein